MKTHYRIKINHLLLILAVILCTSCSKDKSIDTLLTGKIALKLQNIEITLKSLKIEDVSAVYISIKNSSDLYVYNMQKFSLINFNGNYITGNIELTEGNYTVEDFVVVNDSNSAVYISPKEGSEFASLVDYPLPLSFTVSSGDTSLVTLQVIPTDLGDADQYGYAQFTFEIVDIDDTSTLNNGLIAYYPFNGNANDYSGNENNGTEYYSSNYADGVIGLAKDFDGKNDYIMLDSSLDVSNGLTFSFWINSRGTTESSYNGVIICKYNPSGYRSFAVNSFGSYKKNIINSLSCNFYKYGTSFTYRDMVNSTTPCLDSIPEDMNSALYTIVNPTEITINSWTFCVVNVTETEIQLWINNELTVKKQREYNEYFNTDYEPTYIGNNFGGAIPDYHLNGLLDELRVYNRALTEDEIEQLFKLR